MASPRSTLVLVLGMHRSGTSALTRVLNLLGVSLGDTLIEGIEGNNRLGFWEDKWIVGCHDTLLMRLGRDWSDTRALPDNWLSSDVAQQAKLEITDHLRSSFSGTRLWGLKDPRMCRLMPLWLPLLNELNVEVKVILAFRHPAEVAASLIKRDGMSNAAARLLWLEHMAEAELSTRHLDRVCVSYDQLLSDWKTCVESIEKGLRLSWPVSVSDVSKAIDDFLSVGERHHRVSLTTEIEGIDLDIVDQFYNDLVAVEHGAPIDGLSLVTGEYQRFSGVFFPVQSDLCAERDEAIRLLSARNDALLQSIKDLGASLTWGETSGVATGVSDHAKLFFRGESDVFTEEKTVTVEHNGMRDETSLVFRLDADQLVDFIRFDPSDFPGEYQITRLSANGVVALDLNELMLDTNCYISDSSASELHLICSGMDPYIEFDLRSLLAGQVGGVVIEIACSKDVLRSRIGSAIAKAIDSGVNGPSAAAAQERLAARESFENHFRQISAQQKEVLDMNGTLMSNCGEMLTGMQTIKAQIAVAAQRISILNGAQVEQAARLSAVLTTIEAQRRMHWPYRVLSLFRRILGLRG